MATGVERVLSVVLTVAAVVIAAAVVRREFFAPAIPPLASTQSTIEYEPDWRSLLVHGIPEAQTVAPAVLIEFVDIECPACRSFHLNALRSAREEFGDKLEVRFIHWPLSNHRFARPGAEAAECAHRQGRFTEFLDEVFASQDSLGLRSWVNYAAAAGIGDTMAFGSCLSDPAALRARIDSGVATAERKRLFGTPTILVNGWRFPAPPSSVRLNEVIRDVLAGRDPKP